MAREFTVLLSEIMQELSLENVYLPEAFESVLIRSSDVNRPGLALSGYLDIFDHDRVQVLGKSEFGFLDSLDPALSVERLTDFVALRPPAIIVTRDLPVPEGLLAACRTSEVPLFRTKDMTSNFMGALIAFLTLRLAPRITQHGVLVEIYGEGVLLTGDSGVGKSETAIELIKRGHRLIADDAVEIRRVSSKTLVGSAPENIRHFIELRGVGIVNARRIFGIGAVKLTEKIDMVIKMEQWDSEKMYDRMGLDSEYAEILGIQVEQTTIPVRPGRNLAVIIEVAAMNHRQKRMGYNAARELMQRLGMEVDEDPGALKSDDWE